MSDNGIDFSIGFDVNQSEVAKAKTAAASVSDAFQKSADALSRSKGFDDLAKTYAYLAAEGKDAASATAQLTQELHKLGATEAEINRTAKAFDRQTEAIKRSKEAAAEPQTRLERFENVEGASGKIGDVGDSLSALGSATGIGALGDLGGVFEGIEAIARLKAGFEALPESVNATAQALGLAKAAQEATATVTGVATAAEAAQATATGAVAVSSGGAAVGLGAMLIPLLPIAAAAVAVGAAIAGLAFVIGDLQKKSEEASAALKARYDAEDEIDSFARSGATLADAYEKQAELQDIIADATRRRNEAEEEAAADFARRASAPILGDLTARLQDLFNINSRDDVFNERIAETDKAADEAAPKLEELNKQIKDGKFAAGDATEAAKTQQKEQEKIARDTERQQEQQRVKAEQAAERVQQAQEDIAKSQDAFANKQIDQARQAREKLADIEQSALDKREDTDKSYYRDTVKLAQDARLADFKARQQDEQDEINAARDTNRKLEDIRDSAIQDEESALAQRNFLQAARIQEGLEKANKQALKEAERGAEDREEANKQEAKDRYDALQEARDERLDGLNQERQDNATARTRELRNARTARERQIDETQRAYDVELDQKQAQLNKLLGLDQAFYAQQTSMAQAAANGGSTQTGISSGGSGRAVIGSAGGFTGGSSFGLRPITTSTRATTNNITIVAGATDRELTNTTVRVLNEIGLT